MFVSKDNIIKENIKPNRIKFKNEYYRIEEIPQKYIIREYIIKTINNKLDMIILKTPHPNCNPRTNEFCIPCLYRNMEYNQLTKGFINILLSCYNFDNCYFTIWNELKICTNEGESFHGR